MMIHFFKYGLVLGICGGLSVWANTPTSPILQVKPETLLTSPVVLPTPTNEITPTVHQPNALHLQNFDELIHYPEVLERLLDKAVGDGDMGLLGQVLPVYQRAMTQGLVNDAILLDYATALYARSQGKFEQASQILSRLSKQHPEHKPIQLQLAMTDLANKRHRSAQKAFAKVKTDPNLPDGLKRQIDAYEQQIKDDYFDIDVGFRYLNDDNVNNAPKQSTYGNWELPKPESAQGIGYSVGGSGKVPVFDHVSLSYGLMGFGKYYWDNKAYNDHTTRLSLGGIYENARQSVAVGALVSQRQFANDTYSKSVGMEVKHSLTVNPRLQANHSLQISKVKHNTRTHLDGTDVGLSGTWVRGLTLPYRYMYGGYDVAYDNAQDDSDKSVQAGVRLGVGRQFGAVMVDGSLGVHRRQYQAKDFFQIKRHETIYNTDVSLWKKDWHYRGFVPKLVLSYEKTDSNHFMYDNDNHEVYLTVQKMY